MALLKKHFCSLLNGANYWVKATGYVHDASAGEIIFLEGAEITSSVNASGKVKFTTAQAHGLAVGDVVRVKGHRNTGSPAAADLIDETVEYPVLTVPDTDELTIDLTYTADGARGIVGKPTTDLLRDTNLEAIYVSERTSFDEAEDRVG